MGEHIERFPLFPLGLVLLPQEAVPLHIFEERYKLMIGECIEREAEFGIVWMADRELREVGCTATVADVLQRMEDGRLNILVQGTRPFRLVRRLDDMPYPAGDVELLDDEPGEEDGDPGRVARERYATLVERATSERPPDADLAELDAYGMAATLDFELDAKQDLLELRSEDRRLERLATLFESALERVDRAQRVSERASRNGSVAR